jgi:hypothetical protein
MVGPIKCDVLPITGIIPTKNKCVGIVELPFYCYKTKLGKIGPKPINPQ